MACDVLLMRRQEGRLGDPETAKTALDYVVAVSVNAREAAERGDAWKHVGLLVKQEKTVVFRVWVFLLKALCHMFTAAIQRGCISSILMPRSIKPCPRSTNG